MVRKIKYGFLIGTIFILSGLFNVVFHGLGRDYNFVKYLIIIAAMSGTFYYSMRKVKTKKTSFMFCEITQIGFYSLIIASIYHLATSVYQFVIIKPQFLQNLEKDLIRNKVPPNQIVKVIQSFSSNDAVYYTVEGAVMTLLFFVVISGILTYILIKILNYLTGRKEVHFIEEKS